MKDTGVVDQDVHTAQLFGCRLDGSGDVFRAGYITFHTEAAGQLRRGSRNLFLIDVQHRDFATFVVQTLGDGKTKALSSSGHDSTSVFKSQF